jgi:DNA invertase Pin-like site-specific DNA recombinase
MYNAILEPAHLYKTGFYIRLSKEDEDKEHRRETESESIQNQRSLLMAYLKCNGFVLTDEYVDDGYSGTTFDRPDFKRMIADIESGKINCVITKDSSRLGRDYIQSGHYIENYFPLKKVRFISILDNVDTFMDSANNDIAPFKALFNDMTSKDTSKKIRSILKDKKEKGKFIGSAPSYGYMRNPLDRGHLILNPETAPIVKRIFHDIANGIKPSDVIERLNQEGVKTPSAYKGMKKSSRQIHGDIWTISCISKILKNRMYTGDMVQNVQAKLNYKSNKRIALSSGYWIIVEGTHEPLVSREVFEKIQNSPNRTRITKHDREKRLLEGLVYCKECGNAISVNYRRSRNYWTMNCNRYSRSPRQKLCTPHFFPYNVFEEQILNQVKKTCKEYLDSIDTGSLAKTIKSIDDNKEISTRDDEIITLKSTIRELQRKIDSIYEDKFNGIIPADTYMRLSKDTEDRLKALNLRLNVLEAEKEEQKPEKIDLKILEQKIKNLISIKKPTRELLAALIKRIEVDNDKNVEITYSFS